MTTIKSHLSTGELEARYETAGDPIAKSHFHALWLLSKGYDLDEVAELLSFSTRWVYQLVKRYNAGGPSCLGDQRANNGTEPTIVTPQAVAALKERIKTPPDDGGLWTGPKVARWLATFHALKSVHDQRGWDALVAIGYSIQKPRPRHPETASDADQASLKKLQRAVAEEQRKKPGAAVEIWAMDEHRIGLKPITRGGGRRKANVQSHSVTIATSGSTSMASSSLPAAARCGMSRMPCAKKCSRPRGLRQIDRKRQQEERSASA